jgi:serine/threonine protein kinase
MLMVHHKRKLRAFFQRNGGPMLENINNIKIFTKEQLKQITQDYSIVLGKGGFGQVYMGTMEDNKQVAVKRSISVDEARKKEFANEVIIQSRISHRNIIRLVGCCLEVDVPMLVYEFASRGSLYDVLHGATDNTKAPLPLGTRLDIAVDSAEALSYMHTSATQKILHGDVKSGNILLDQNFSPKVSDFGTSRLLSIQKKHTVFVIGDMNYIDPVYMKTGRLDEKSDVYSFGVVLLELITRKKPRYDGNNSLLINFIKSYTSDGKAREMYDTEIASSENIEFLDKVGSIAVACLKEEMDERPNMKEVGEHLQLVRREWKQRQGTHGAGIADDVSMENPASMTMDAPAGGETPGYSPLVK